MNPVDKVLALFEQISAIPRGTKREGELSAWLQHWASQHGFPSQTDDAGNLLIRIPGSPGGDAGPVIALQGHLDMVCEKTADSPHDFTRDPIRCIRDGDWLRADRTTLGADNGISIAIAMALVEDKGVVRPPLELLFTVEEEVGIGGAANLDPHMLSASLLINLDSEDDGVFVIGCAGGKTSHIQMPVARTALADGDGALAISVEGLKGGHSGLEIHKRRSNANKILARALILLSDRMPIRLSRFSGGTAHNAIPRQAKAVFICPQGLVERCHELLESFELQVQREYADSDPGLTLALAAAADSHSQRPIVLEETERVLRLLADLPDGVARMSTVHDGVVETSSNLAIADLADTEFKVLVSQRSLAMASLHELTERVEQVVHSAGATFAHTDGYPAWEPNPASPLLARCDRIYQGLFGTAPQIQTIHAGLECGIIGMKYPQLDMISLGPTIQGAHTPNERLYIPSVERVYALLADVLKSYRDPESSSVRSS